MGFLKNKLTLFVLCALLAAAASQASQGRPHVPQGGGHERQRRQTSQGWPHESQGGAHVSQGGSQLSQAGPHESQGKSHESQGGTHESQGGAHELQGGTHESQGGSHESQGGSHESQGGAHEDQGRVRRQAPIEEDEPDFSMGPNWTKCDVTTTPLLTCRDCKTRLRCRPVGGLLLPCPSPFRPYCNNGICSPAPAPGCK